MAAAVTNMHACAGTSVGRKLLSSQNGGPWGKKQLKTPDIKSNLNPADLWSVSFSASELAYTHQTPLQ